jgi:RNA polymerase sigma-70 factor (ECF subfamily)
MMGADKVIPFPGRKALEHGNRPLGELGDDELMLLARGGVDEAFDALVRRHQTGVLKVAAKLLGRVELARDAAQRTFLEIYRYLMQYQARGKFRQFMFQVLMNQCRMVGREAQRDKKLQARLAVEPRENGDLPDERILARERRRELELLLLKLSKKLRVVLVLRFSGELSYQEIGEVLDLPVGTVKSRVFSGLEKLRRLMKGKSR